MPEVLAMYYPLHEADLSKFVAAANGIIERTSRLSESNAKHV